MRTRSRPRFTGTLLVLAVALLVAPTLSCGGERGEAARPKVRVALHPFLSYAPLILAKEAGDFETEGLEVELVAMKGSKGAVPLLLSREIDVLPAALGPGLFNAIGHGGGVRLVADKGRFPASGCTHLALAVREEILREGRLIWRGRALSLSADPGMTSEFFAERALARVGFPLGRVRIVAIPNEVEVAALEKGSLDLAVVGTPWLPLPSTTRGVRILTREIDVLPLFQSGVLAYGPRLTEDAPIIGKRFMVAYLQGIRRYNHGKTPENIATLARVTGLDPDLLRRTCWPPVQVDGRLDSRSIQMYQEWAVQKGYVDRVLPESLWGDPRFLDYATGRLKSTDAGEGGS